MFLITILSCKLNCKLLVFNNCNIKLPAATIRQSAINMEFILGFVEAFARIIVIR